MTHWLPAWSRPGFWLIIGSWAGQLVATVVAGIMESKVQGSGVWPWVYGLIIAWVCGVVGFIKYAHSKGYSGWVGFLLCLAEWPGTIVLLVLPDRNRY
jgi:hypothetical protein